MRAIRSEWIKIGAWIGVALSLGGYIRYQVQGEMLWLSETLLIAGGAILLASAVLGFRGILSFFSRRSSKLGTNTLVMIAAVLAILVAVNYEGSQHFHRFDLTTEHLYSLSDQTRKIVGGLKSNVEIVRFIRPPQSEDQRQFNDLMDEYTHLSRHLSFKDVDPDQKPEIAREFGAKSIGDVVVRAGTRTEHVSSMGGNPGESDVTSAILKVTRNAVKTVCFVTGHGEKSLADTQEAGYSEMDAGLKKEGYDTKSVNLVTEDGVPSDCSVLAIAGPTTGYLPQETALISKYLDNGGKALVEIDPQTDPKLDSLLDPWNVKLGDDVVIDASGMGRLLGMGPAAPLVIDYGDSPITKDLRQQMTFFPLARTVAAGNSTGAAETTELLKTSPASFTIPKLVREVSFDPKTDTKGPLSLGVSATKTEGAKTSRLVVIGNSAFAENQYQGIQRNGDLFFNAIDWLAQDENLISIRPKSVTSRSITLTETQQRTLWWLDMIFLPGIVIFSGIYLWWRRR